MINLFHFSNCFQLNAFCIHAESVDWKNAIWGRHKQNNVVFVLYIYTKQWIESDFFQLWFLSTSKPRSFEWRLILYTLTKYESVSFVNPFVLRETPYCRHNFMLDFFLLLSCLFDVNVHSHMRNIETFLYILTLCCFYNDFFFLNNNFIKADVWTKLSERKSEPIVGKSLTLFSFEYPRQGQLMTRLFYYLT